MKLNLDIICDYLPSSIKKQRFGPSAKCLSLNFPILYETGCEITSNQLYITRTETLPKTPPLKEITIVCLGQGLPQEWMNSGCHVLLVSNCPSLFYLVNEINRIYEKFIKWDERLRDELEDDDNFDIREILKTGTMLLENPILVVNNSMLNILGTEIVTHDDEPDGGVTASNKYAAVTSEKIKDACRLERVIKEPYVSAVTFEGKQSYCNNLYPFGHFAGCISISELNRPFKDSDFCLASHFFGYFQKAYAKYLRRKPIIEIPGTTALKNLLKGIPLSSDESKDFEIAEGERLLCFKLKNIRTTNYLPIEYMCTSINMLFPGKIFAIIDDDEIFGVLKFHEDGNAFSKDLLESLDGYLKRMGYIAGLSDGFFDINETRIYKKLASYALEMGSQSNQDIQIFRFNDYVLNFILTRYDETFPAKYLYPKGLLTLKEYSEEGGIDFFETLDCYLRNERSTTHTAEELYLHRSSLVYRLNKIKKLLNVDWEDPDIRLYLRMCLYLSKKEQAIHQQANYGS